MTGISFGFLEDTTKLRWKGGNIEPLPEHSDIVAEIRSHERVYSGWRYPSLAQVSYDNREEKPPPAMPTNFTLPATHRLTLADTHLFSNAENFLIALFGLLKGLRLQREGWQHFYNCPVKQGILCDFYADDREIEQALDVATHFWCSHPDNEVRKLIFGSLHWHLFAQLYKHEFELFNAQYMALDACAKLAEKLKTVGYKHSSHTQRPQNLCTALRIPTPDWAEVRETKCALAERRNALIHEAMYADQPVGFAAPTEPTEHPNMTLELTGLVARIYLRLLGIENEYTKSPCNMRQTIGFTFG